MRKLIVVVQQKQANRLSKIHYDLDLIDLLIIGVLSLEVVLKWLNDFQRFWYCWCNIFDLVIISITTVPAVF